MALGQLQAQAKTSGFCHSLHYRLFGAYASTAGHSGSLSPSLYPARDFLFSAFPSQEDIVSFGRRTYIYTYISLGFCPVSLS